MNKRFRFIFLLVVIGLAFLLLYPTINWYFMVPEDVKTITSGSREEIRRFAQTEAAADLGELTELIRDDENAQVPQSLEHVQDLAREILRAEDADLPEAWTVQDVLAAFRSEDDALRRIEDYYRQDIISLKEQKNRIINLGLDLSGGINVVLEADVDSLTERLGREPSEEELSTAIDLALEILNNRIDTFGVTEPIIRRQEGSNRIEIEIPGDNDPERVNAFLMGRGSLNLQIVDDEATEELVAFQEQFRSQNNVDWDPERDAIPEFVPAGAEVRPYVQKDEYDIDYVVRYIVTKEDSASVLDGSHIEEADTSSDQLTGRPTTIFRLDNEGANLFQDLTRDNVGSSLAIVMDGKVRAYARISEEIPGGSVRITGFTREESQNIATVLQTAALPVDLVIVNQQSVGASLGQDAVDAGIRAIMYGLIAVIIFMLIYYKGAGIIATLGLTLNLFFIVSLLSAFNLTLTLTSIAGLILTVGMAVDANVIIFERIKEEYRLGKTAAASVQAGYKKAFWTIMDANLTTGIAAVLLSFLGTGPIQGFAVTLSVGIFSSLFTALWISRLFFNISTEGLGREKLSISWRTK
ncbi:protein translocase subunit SecD [Salinispira pacifica]|uniref:Protein translocase subunit SecD n=1 Tax=Salinispira pacifica TaxID=1307761 RepID=V5WD64_9SPIO|nr:protein translocase subunit SecD [Salinispira pacifica]AHC13768.1 Protein-export membrane protein SecD [Salinispira pacifica]